MTLSLLTSLAISTATLCYSPNLPQVAERRINAGWGLESVKGYDGLIGTPNCGDLGRNGWLFVGDKALRIIVADCARPEHREAMVSQGLLDVSLPLSHRKGWMVLE